MLTVMHNTLFYIMHDGECLYCLLEIIALWSDAH
jgi:predicted DCC family thiol-disulfide oxidoreductase YuxK